MNERCPPVVFIEVSMPFIRRSWAHWRRTLELEQALLVKQYRKRILPLIHPYLSVLCRHKRPYHHDNSAVDSHLNEGSWWFKLPEITSGSFAHHLFDPHASLYYVSGTGEYGLLAFDIDSKAGPTDALEFAQAIQRQYFLAGASFIQPSTSGNGAYLYVPVITGTELPRQKLNELCTDMGDVVREEFSGRFKSELDAVKGTFPAIEVGDDYRVYCRNQGVLVRAPVWETLEQLEGVVSGTSILPFMELVALLGIRSKTTSVPLSHEPPRAPECALPLPSSLPPDTHAHKSVGAVTRIPPLSLSPWQRVNKALKQFRDVHQRNPNDFFEFNACYEGLGLNTGPARPGRRARYERLLSLLGSYRSSASTSFSLDRYMWIEKHVTPELIAHVKGKDRHNITFEDLAVVQYVAGLATVTQEKNLARTHGMPLARIEATYKALGEAGIISAKYGKSKTSLVKRILEAAGLLICIDGSYGEGRSKKYVVTDLDEVFGAKGRKKPAA